MSEVIQQVSSAQDALIESFDSILFDLENFSSTTPQLKTEKDPKILQDVAKEMTECDGLVK